ncbi:MAG TPA: ABC transporter ATP-binding protein [Rhodothermales bacterium]
MTRDFGAIRAIDSLSLEVPQATLFGLLGPNGAGKTTTIRLLLGLLQPTSGRAEVLGLDTQKEGQHIRTRVGALLEHTGLYEQLTAEENLDFFGRVWKLPHPTRRARIEELLREIGLWDRRTEPVGKWSKGMRQRLALARALLHHPTLLLLDEPTAGLDVVAASQVREALTNMVRHEGLTVVLTTHNMLEAERLCDTLGVIRKGRLVAVDQPDQLRANHAAPCLEIRGGNFSTLVQEAIRIREEVTSVELANGTLTIEFDRPIDSSPIVRLLIEHGASVQEVLKRTPSLEDVFLALTEDEK